MIQKFIYAGQQLKTIGNNYFYQSKMPQNGPKNFIYAGQQLTSITNNYFFVGPKLTKMNKNIKRRIERIRRIIYQSKIIKNEQKIIWFTNYTKETKIIKRRSARIKRIIYQSKLTKMRLTCKNVCWYDFCSTSLIWIVLTNYQYHTFSRRRLVSRLTQLM